MPFEELDKKIKEAADQHHPAYDEKAWDRMEKLLNKYLPEGKKDRRRIVFWLFLFLLAGGGTAYFLISKPPVGSDTAASGIENVNKPSEEFSSEKNTPPQPGSSKKENETGSFVSGNKKQTDNNSTPYLPLNENNKQNQSIPVKPQQLFLTKSKMNKTAVSAVVHKPEQFHKMDAEKNKQADAIQNADQKQKINPDPFQNITTAVNTPVSKNTQQAELKKPAEKAAVAVNNETKENDIAELKKESSKKNRKHKFADGIFVSVSAGPDVGSVGLDNPGKLKLSYGAGIGYHINKRFSVQTGFYSSRKIYTAAPEDYHPPAWWWNYYPNLQKVDADCKVFEIPLLVTHFFKAGKKAAAGNWFVSYGLSSYLMKKENYTYHYKTYAGQYQRSSWSTTNQNKHIFSVINLSGGYQRSITKNVSVSATPYLKLPWQGVGFGKIKLNSGGILLNVTVNPFKK